MVLKAPGKQGSMGVTVGKPHSRALCGQDETQAGQSSGTRRPGCLVVPNLHSSTLLHSLEIH